MPKFCKVKASEFSDYEIVTNLYENICEFAIPRLGIDPGVEKTPWFNPVWEAFDSFTDPYSCWFQILILLFATTAAFLLGVYVR